MQYKLILRMLSVLALLLGSVIAAQDDEEPIDLPDSIRYQGETGGTLTVRYPEDWVVRTSSEGLFFADSSANLLELEGEPESGEFQLNVISVNADDLQGFMQLDEKPSLVEAVGLVIQIIQEQELADLPGTFKMGEAVEIDTTEQPAARAAGTVTFEDTSADVMVYVFEEGSAFVGMILFAAGGEAGQYAPTLDAMVDAMTYADVDGIAQQDFELTETIAFESSDGSTLIVHYPDGWAARAGVDELTFADSEATLDNDEDALLTAGQFELRLFAMPRVGLLGFDLPINSDAGDVVDAMKELFFTGEGNDFDELGLTFDETSFQRRARNSTASALGRAEGVLDVMLVTMEQRNTFFAAILATSSGEAMSYREVLVEMMMTAEYIPPN